MATYRVKPHMRFGAQDQHGPGDLVELDPAHAQGFLDKLEPVQPEPEPEPAPAPAPGKPSKARAPRPEPEPADTPPADPKPNETDTSEAGE